MVILLLSPNLKPPKTNLKTPRGERVREAGAPTLEQLEVGVDLLQEVGGDPLTEAKTGTEKRKENTENGIGIKPLVLEIRETERQGLKTPGGRVETDQIDLIETPKETPTGDLNQNNQAIMKEIMMTGKGQEAPHLEEETEIDMRRETVAPAMRRRKEEEEGEAEATAQMIEVGGDIIAKQGENSAQGP